MSDQQTGNSGSNEPELKEEGFVTHLVELRDRLVRAAIALIVVFLSLVYWAPDIYSIWAFIAPGLYEHEKKLAAPIILSSFLLFLLGMAFAYLFVFPAVFKFVAAYTPAGVQMATDIDKYLSFVMTLFLVFGLSFETPVVEMVLVRLGMVSIAKLRDFRSYFIVIAFVIAAIVTPPDVISQFMLAVPMILLYELGIFMSRWITPREKSD